MSPRSTKSNYTIENGESQNICELAREDYANETGPIIPDEIAKMPAALDLPAAPDLVVPTADVAPERTRSKKVTGVGLKTRLKKLTKRIRRTDSCDTQTVKKIQQFRVPAELANWPSFVSE